MVLYLTVYYDTKKYHFEKRRNYQTQFIYKVSFLRLKPKNKQIQLRQSTIHTDGQYSRQKNPEPTCALGSGHIGGRARQYRPAALRSSVTGVYYSRELGPPGQITESSRTISSPGSLFSRPPFSADLALFIIHGQRGRTVYWEASDRWT